MRLVFLLVLVYAVGPIASLDIRHPTFEVIRVCDDSPVRMYLWQIYGQGYWNGRLEIIGWPRLSEITFSLSLDESATIELKNMEKYRVEATNGNKNYNITAFDAYNLNNQIAFTVRFDPKKFPNIVAMKFFNLDVCLDPLQVKISNTYIRMKRNKIQFEMFFFVRQHHTAVPRITYLM